MEEKIDFLNPFTPSEIAVSPEDFFGRTQELHQIERSLRKGCVAIQGPIGIGKSSLLAQARLVMEGFNSGHDSKVMLCVGDRDIQTIDDAARLVLESFTNVDKIQNKISFKLPKIIEFESTEIMENFKEGRHLAALKGLLDKNYISDLLEGREYLIIAIDESDKCPCALARLIRSVLTFTQQSGFKNIRFLLAGVSPFFQKMVDEDAGITRFFYKAMVLLPMLSEDALMLLETKFNYVREQAAKLDIDLVIDGNVLKRVIALSGGHPHILQLLGSHLIEHENEIPDNIIDSKDLMNSLRRIVYEDRARAYDSMINLLELNSMDDKFKALLALSSSSIPTRIPSDDALEILDSKDIQWLSDNNFLIKQKAGYWGLVDEFLRIRFLLDEVREEQEEMRRLERKLISPHMIQDYGDFYDENDDNIQRDFLSDQNYESEMDYIERDDSDD